MNEEPGACIAVVWLKTEDAEGNPLLEYLLDLELSIERGGAAEGVQAWFSESPIIESEIQPSPLPLDTSQATRESPAYPSPYP